jgi:inward rectifier potassium channel
MARQRQRNQIQTFAVERRNVRRAILSDLYHFLIDRSWGHLLGLLAGFYAVANLVFAGLYMLGGDCISGATTFKDHYFFSVHTLSTIGYGTMAPRTTYANVLVAVQAFLGTVFVAVTTGLVFAKFSRPTARVMWSKNAVIVEREGRKVLMFRMANERANQIVEATCRAAVARTVVTADGERLRRFQDVKLERHRTIVFVLSWTVMHVIDEQSPFWGLTIEKMKQDAFQLICSVVGTDETFSQQVHARNSYNPEDFVWDRRFADIIGNNPDGTRYVDYALFHELVPMGTRWEVT